MTFVGGDGLGSFGAEVAPGFFFSAAIAHCLMASGSSVHGLGEDGSNSAAVIMIPAASATVPQNVG